MFFHQSCLLTTRQALMRILFFVCAILSVFVLLTYFFFSDRPFPASTWGQVLVVRRSMTLRHIFLQAREKGLYAPFWVWRVLFDIQCFRCRFYAGYYTIHQGDSLMRLIRRFHEGIRTVPQFVIIEGSTWQSVQESLSRVPDLIHDIVPGSDQELLRSWGDSEHSSLEGFLFPSTYQYVPGDRESDVVQRAFQKMQKVLSSVWTERDPHLPLSQPYALLIMASLVEKEVHLEKERPQVASVFYNRLHKKMMLQTDPTVYYAARRSYRETLQLSDLASYDAHNTYRYRGLPSTPICFPSESSLKAAAHPLKTSYYYFVARGDGSSYFSHSLRQHSWAIQHFLGSRHS